MKRLAFLAHADAACCALLARQMLIDAIYDDSRRDFWRERAFDQIRYADEFSADAKRLERKHGSVFPGGVAMTDTICGHERQRLIFVLERADTCPGECDWKMVKLVYDPAKLAEIMAALLRSFGLRCYVDTCGAEGDDPPGWGAIWCILADSSVHNAPALAFVPPVGGGAILHVLLPDARKLALQWLDMPKGTPLADVLRALEAP